MKIVNWCADRARCQPLTLAGGGRRTAPLRGQRPQSFPYARNSHARRFVDAVGVSALVMALLMGAGSEVHAQGPDIGQAARDQRMSPGPAPSGADSLVRAPAGSAARRSGHDTVGGDAIDALVGMAMAVNPALRAAQERVGAARARVTPAGLFPDPMLMVGIQNVPLGRDAGMRGPDEMTMRMIGIGQTLPYPGKLSLARRVAVREVEAAEAAFAATTQQVMQEVRAAYYELAYLDRAFEIVERNQRLLAEFVSITDVRYSVGVTGQQDVLRSRVEATRLAETAVALTEDRRAALARLNAALDRPSESPVTSPQVPTRVARAAVADSAGRIRFVSAALGARAADSPLPSLVALQESAVRESPVLREQAAMIAAQAARLELASKAYLPDFDLSLQYGQRGGGRPDMVTALVSIPIPVQKGRKQDAYVAAARADLAALEAELHARKNELRADVARLHAELERQRAQLALYVKAIIPQGRASLTSATASYQVGRVEFLTVLDNQATLFNYETEYFRTLTEFATTLAELERVVGKEIIQ